MPTAPLAGGLDSGHGMGAMLPPSQTVLEAEGRRNVFWLAYLLDRQYVFAFTSLSPHIPPISRSSYVVPSPLVLFWAGHKHSPIHLNRSYSQTMTTGWAGCLDEAHIGTELPGRLCDFEANVKSSPLYLSSIPASSTSLTLLFVYLDSYLFFRRSNWAPVSACPTKTFSQTTPHT